jgi:hypothetical protein
MEYIMDTQPQNLKPDDEPDARLPDLSQESTDTPATSGPLPTNKLEGFKAGKKAIQFLVTQRNHLYDAKEFEAGDCAVQIMGAWDGPTILGVMDSITHRQDTIDTSDLDDADPPNHT